MVKCPHCNGVAMGVAQKAALGPGRAVACQSCGKAVAAHWIGILAALPAFAGGFVLLRGESVALGLVAVASGLALMAALQIFVVPLVRAEP